MTRLLLLVSFLCIQLGLLQGQALFSEDFESGELPLGWSIETKAIDNGWNVGSTQALSSQDFFYTANGSSNIIGTNDDACDCDKSSDLLITDLIDPLSYDNLFLNFDLYFSNRLFQFKQEAGTVELSYDKVNWEVLDTLHGHLGVWDTHNISLADKLGAGPFYIGFRYNDDESWLFGMGLDNISVTVPPAMEIELFDAVATRFGETNCPIDISAAVWNKGGEVINDITVSLTVNGVTTSQEFNDLNLLPLEFRNLDLSDSWLPERAGFFNITLEISTPGDNSLDNNTVEFQAEIFDKLTTPDKILEIFAMPKVEEVEGATANLELPTDLDFFPINGKDELWIVNQRVEDSGGSTVIVRSATQGPQSYVRQVDGNAWHFMSLPTGIAFSDDNFNFATSPGVLDANHSGGTFTGPALWSSDPAIYAQPSGGNGSHLDMLHGSPFSMGIAHEKDNVFWVYDDYNNDIVRYDFVDDHGPGADDHSDGIIHRYSDIGIAKRLDIPNHLIMDKESGWLYFTDNGKSRVMRLDINSGTGSSSLGLLNEPLAEHRSISGFTVETIIDSELIFPAGIEIFEGKLLVGDWATGEIIAYDMNNNFEELGRIETEQGLCGIKVGPDGNIWSVNREGNTLNVISVGDDVSNSNIDTEERVRVYPNPTHDRVAIKVNHTTDYVFRLSDAQGKVVLTETMNGLGFVDLDHLDSGMYSLQVMGKGYSHSQKLIITR